MIPLLNHMSYSLSPQYLCEREALQDNKRVVGKWLDWHIVGTILGWWLK